MDSEPTQDPKPVEPIKVSIRHGDLAYARHPVLVGHYRGDVIINAEKQLDRRFCLALSHRSTLGLYPGRHGTHVVFFSDDKRAKPSGAIVVGLGQVGGLTPVLLQSGVRDALIDFALQVSKWPDERFDTASGARSAAVSCLLVGSGTAGVTVGDSVGSIVRAALQANEQIEKAREQLVKANEQLDTITRQVSIDYIEFIDVYRDMALNVADALQSLLEDKGLDEKVKWEPSVIDEGEGRLYRLRSTEPEGWWHPLEIVQERIDEKWLGLRFIASNDGARAEVTKAVGQLRLAESFITDATNTWASNDEVGKTLYEILLPNRLKEITQHRGNLVLLVDEVSARYPWEALEDRWDANKCPVAIASGMVRQLKTTQFRPRPAYALSKTALVVGNPTLKWSLFRDLPGAKKEGDAVADLLKAAGYRVDRRVGQLMRSVVEGLHMERWRILHLAGHGVHEFPIEKDKVYPTSDERAAEPESDDAQKTSQKKQLVSGMVIGKEAILTPGDVEQMRWTPEFVFINCCYLAKSTSDTPRRFNELAANLGVQFINMGVKAVIAAGWAVHDDASHEFAKTFYDHMLNGGQTFGEAVRLARKHIWDTFKETANTWGAYQCYGDPGFRLTGEGTAQQPTKRTAYHSPCELIADLENLSEQIRVQSGDTNGDTAPVEQWRKDISASIALIPKAKRKEWAKRADVAAAIGFACGEINEWVKAITFLETAVKAEKSSCPLRVVEQCANFKVRHAAKQWSKCAPADRDRKRDEYVGIIQKAIAHLKSLSDLAETEERSNLMGGAYKRLALVHLEPSDRCGALKEMARYYEKAYLKRNNAYAFTNWATALMLTDPTIAMTKGRSVRADAVGLQQALAKKVAKEPNFWDSAAIADIDLVCLIVAWFGAASATLNEEAATLKEDVIGGYRRACERGASPRERGSVIENLNFVIEMIESPEDPLRKAVQEIRDSL
jgi:CHAT domain-containing protein